MSGRKKREVDEEGRQFQKNWTEEFFFTLHNGQPVRQTGQTRKDKTRIRRTFAGIQQLMFHKQRRQPDNVVKASFVVNSKFCVLCSVCVKRKISFCISGMNPNIDALVSQSGVSH